MRAGGGASGDYADGASDRSSGPEVVESSVCSFITIFTVIVAATST